MRGGPRVRLHADAVPRRGRRAADRPADPPDRRRSRRDGVDGCWRVSTRSSRSGATSPQTSCAGQFGGGGTGARRRGSVRALDAGRWGAADRASRRRSSRICRAAARPSAASMSRCSGSPSSGWPGSTRTPSRPARSATRSRRTRRSTGSTPAWMAPTPPSSSTRRRSHRSRRSPVDGDVMPQKSTYFYPKALTGLVINPLEW